MSYMFAAFRSREETVRFYEGLRARRVNCSIINTPKEASVGCGISAKYDIAAQNTAKLILERGAFRTFIGFFTVDVRFGKKYVVLSV